MPFEFHGAVSRWRIELPWENNYFPRETFTDCAIHLNHTGREGGEMLRRVASEEAQKHLPGSGWCFFDVRHEFPDAWQLLQNSAREKSAAAKLGLRLDRKMFPLVPGAWEISITKMALLFSSCGDWDRDCPKVEECPCTPEREPACRIVEFAHATVIGMTKHCTSLVWQRKNGLVSLRDCSIRMLGRSEDRASVRMSDSGSRQRSAKWSAFFCYAATAGARNTDVTALGNDGKMLVKLPGGRALVTKRELVSPSGANCL